MSPASLGPGGNRLPIARKATSLLAHRFKVSPQPPIVQHRRWQPVTIYGHISFIFMTLKCTAAAHERLIVLTITPRAEINYCDVDLYRPTVSTIISTLKSTLKNRSYIVHLKRFHFNFLQHFVPNYNKCCC